MRNKNPNNYQTSKPSVFDLESVPDWDYIMPGGVTSEGFAKALERWLWWENPHIIQEVAGAVTANRKTGMAVLLQRDSGGAARGFRYKEIDAAGLTAEIEPLNGLYIFDDSSSEIRIWERIEKDRRMEIGGPGEAKDDDMPFSMEEAPSPHRAEPGGSDDFFEDPSWTRN